MATGPSSLIPRHRNLVDPVAGQIEAPLRSCHQTTYDPAPGRNGPDPKILLPRIEEDKVTPGLVGAPDQIIGGDGNSSGPRAFRQEKFGDGQVVGIGLAGLVGLPITDEGSPASAPRCRKVATREWEKA